MSTAVESQGDSETRKMKKRRLAEAEVSESDVEAGRSPPATKRRKETISQEADSEVEDIEGSLRGGKSTDGPAQDTKEKKKRRKKKKKIPLVQQARDGSPGKHKPSSQTSAKPASNGKGKQTMKSPQKQPTPGPSRLSQSLQPSVVPEQDNSQEVHTSAALVTLDSVSASSPSLKGKERAASASATTPLPSDSQDVEALTKKLDSVTQKVFPSLICNICLYLMHRPFLLAPCGHVACLSCLVSWFTSEPPRQQPAQLDVPVLPPPPNGGDPVAGGAVDGVAAVPAPAPLARPLAKRKKTCPQCRARILTKPVEVWFAKDMIAHIIRDGLADPDSIPPALREGAPPATEPESADPWRDVFPDVSVAKDRLRQMLSRESLGDQDLADEGIYRCIDCFHEIWDGVCSECGRVYHGHLDGADDFSDEGSMDDDLGYMLGLHPNLRYLDESDDDFYGLPVQVNWTDDEQEPSDAGSESEESYESSFIDDDEGGEGRSQSIESHEEEDNIPAPRRRSRRVDGRSDPFVISSDENDEESDVGSPPSRRYRRRDTGVIEITDDEDENSEHSDDGEDLAAEVAERERELYGDDGSVPSRRLRSPHSQSGAEYDGWGSDAYDETASVRSGSASDGVDYMDDEL